ncbi:probable galacturonosyltransferase 10 [Asparagus officinalis]|uniref:probable galacturonosyltransferase 10 n=1 Tax=Asparagus officinalis TaxID=4686 RepID=UPI00098DFB80|nr:probable galacturonosyltransferase 10 [Asparagus officinalis]
MRRRGFDLRRPGRRRWLSSGWIWFLLIGLGSLLFLLLVTTQEKTPRSRPLIVQNSFTSSFPGDLNVTDELLNPLSVTRQLLDQISLAKTYLVISKENNNLEFARELGGQVRNCQSLLATAATRGYPLSVEESEATIRGMALLLYQAQQLHYDGAITITKMKGQLQTLEEKSKLETDKSSKFGQIAAEELPKSLYCLGIKLTMEWFKNLHRYRRAVEARTSSEKLRNNNLYHYCIFSDNILAASVVVNSTVTNSKHPDLLVFHVVTDEVNYTPMRAWFSMNKFQDATIEVQKFEDFTWLNASYVPILKQLKESDTQSFYFSGKGNSKTPIKFRNPKYLSMLNHLRFYMPEVFPALHKVVFLDDDVVVQKDLSELFSINLNGNVIGAVETCMETFHRFHKYLNFSHPLIKAHFDPDDCGWAFGMNVIDLREWKKKNVTGNYHYWQERNVDHTLWKLGTLPPGLLAFYGMVERLDAKWHVLGLGYKEVEQSAIKEGAVLHYNGNMKPWLKIGMEKYKILWDKYVDYSHPLLQRCFVH